MTKLNVIFAIFVFYVAKGSYLREADKTTPWNLNHLMRHYILDVMGFSNENGYYLINCTPMLKNRLVMFEYLYYGSGSWVYPTRYQLDIGYNTRIMDAKASLDYHWLLGDLNSYEGTTIEPRRKGWEEWYVTRKDYQQPFPMGLTLIDSPQEALSISDASFQIRCPSCIPSGPNDDTYDNCRITTKNFSGLSKYDKLWYVSNEGEVRLYHWESITPSWVNWRIISPASKSYWKRLVTHENCDDPNADPITVGPYIMKTTITQSTSITVSWSIEEKITAGNIALKLLLLDPNPTIRAEWSRTDIETVASEKSLSIGPVVIKPGWKWTVDQFYGDAAYTLIGSERYRSPLKHCNAV